MLFQSYEVDPKVPETKMLATFVDYNLTSLTQYVNIKVGEYFITYNRKKGINMGTKKHEDKVLVVETVPDEKYGAYGYNDTKFVAALDDSMQTTFTIPNYIDDRDLVIKVCDDMVFGPPDYAVVAIGLDATCPELPLEAEPFQPVMPRIEPLKKFAPGDTTPRSKSSPKALACADGKPDGNECKKNGECCSKRCKKAGKNKKQCVSSHDRGRKRTKMSRTKSNQSKGRRAQF